jgi:TonB family protein
MKATMRCSLLALTLLLFTPFNTITAKQGGTIWDDDIKIVDFEELRYPLSARLAHVQGVVVVRVTLDDRGKVVDSVAISGAKSLITDSVSNAKNWRFRPSAQKAAVIVYQFRIDDGLCHGAASSHFVFRPPNFASITSCESVVEP